MNIEIDNLDEIITALNGDENTTIVTTDFRLPKLLCEHINQPYLYITEQLFTGDDTPAPTGISLTAGLNITRTALLDTLARYGYTKTPDRPERGGEFSSRGDIVDFWPPREGSLVRVMLFDNQIEAIKSITPRFSAIETLGEYHLLPIAEQTPAVSTLRVQNLLDQNRGKIKTVVFECPDEISCAMVDNGQTDKLNLLGFVCIGFQITDTTHRLFDISKKITIQTGFRMPDVGDLVVHAHHGLGRYMGIKKMSLTEDTPPKKYLMIEYSRGAVVYLPFDKTELLANYYGGGRRLDGLGR